FTPAGKTLVDYAKRMLIELDTLKDDLFNLNTKVKGELRIGVSSNYANYILPDFLKEFLEIFPNIQLKIKTSWSVNIYKAFKNDELHVAIINDSYPWSGPKVILNKDPLCFISKYKININHLPSKPRIDYETDPSLKKRINQWWESNFSLPPLVSMKTDRMET